MINVHSQQIITSKTVWLYVEISALNDKLKGGMKKRSRSNDFKWEVSESFSKDITFKTWGPVRVRSRVGGSVSGWKTCVGRAGRAGWAWALQHWEHEVEGPGPGGTKGTGERGLDFTWARWEQSEGLKKNYWVNMLVLSLESVQPLVSRNGLWVPNVPRDKIAHVKLPFILQGLGK